ncbi:MAG: glycoside hydrolase family 99-like domain-containing protein [Planctomycetia bacterium]|nr:glycoside hydrolase family 99-like domain-containing protein [Planctomycetia bacterium]
MNLGTTKFYIFLVACLVFGTFVSAGEEKKYVPEPKPVKSDIEITAFYYPGTEQMSEWDIVRTTSPQIKPLLGWYDEGNPEVIDWQIKWAVEHGISTLFVDWYWNRGEQRLDHWVKGYYKAKYRSYLSWALMWANHDQPGAHTPAEMKKVTAFWIDQYFKTPEYYQIDGKPVVLIWSWKAIDQDFIDEAATHGETLAPTQGVKRALKLVNDQAVQADGQFHEYVFQLEKNTSWKGKVNELWLNPASVAHVRIEIDYIRFR